MSYRPYALLPFLLLGLVAMGLILRGRVRQAPPELSAAPMLGEPQLMLWAWEMPEDFTALDPQRAGVAFLARELLLSEDFTVRPRKQPLHVSPGTWLIAVVRMETASNFRPSADAARRAALAIAEAAQLERVRAVQIDFDATSTQRDFYGSVLRDLHDDLPAGYPMSITALVSWCGHRSWLHGLPINEAVPMFFRMGGPTVSRGGAMRTQSAVAEPLCSGSVGLSTDEAWPIVRPKQRVYLFRTGSWTQNDLARVNRFGYEGLRGLTFP